MRSVVIYCPHLNRDIRSILNNVPDVHIHTGYRTPFGHDGCLQCHQDIVSKAKSEGLEKVFVMEDDCEFTEHFKWNKWIEDITWAEFNDYDVLVGGSTRTYEEKLVREGMIEVKAFHSAHCIVYFKSGYDKILQTVQPFDLSIGQCGARIILVHPFVAVQRPSYSGILRENVNYVPLYKQHEWMLAKSLGIETYA